jgi:hypothetical protein
VAVVHDAYGRTLAVGTYNGVNPVNSGKLSIAVGANDTEVTFMPAGLSPPDGDACRRERPATTSHSGSAPRRS